MTTPVEFFHQVIPGVYNRAAAELKKRADAGDATAKARQAELASISVALRVVLEGKSSKDLYLVAQGGTLSTQREKPSAPIILAVSVPLDALEIGLEELEPDLEKGLPRLEKALLKMSASKVKNALDKLAAEKVRFHQVLKDTPDFAEVRVKVALGESEPPEKPAFTVIIAWDLFQSVRAGKIKPQGILSKLQITGDSARAMQLGMDALSWL